jgi:hypothetical protein
VSECRSLSPVQNNALVQFIPTQKISLHEGKLDRKIGMGEVEKIIAKPTVHRGPYDLPIVSAHYPYRGSMLRDRIVQISRRSENLVPVKRTNLYLGRFHQVACESL